MDQANLQLRDQFGTYNTLLPELSNSPKFYAYLRMDVDTFEQWFQVVQTDITRKKTK